jgi:hypothetical protein
MLNKERLNKTTSKFGILMISSLIIINQHSSDAVLPPQNLRRHGFPAADA